MANLLELLKNRGFSPRKISSSHGGEFCSPCPGPICKGAGEDRFHIWPYRENSGKCVGRFWCRQCDISGDTIAFLQQVDGLTFPDACAELGIAIEAKQSQRRSRYQPPPAPLSNQEQVWQPRSYPEPGAVWQEKAANLLADCQSRLLSTPEALSWLTARGIDTATAKAYGLGYNLSSKGKDRYRPRERWGLPEKTQGGKAKRLWLPAGWVIPSYNLAGQLIHLRIRRRDEDIASFGKNIKYLPVDGSSMATMVLHPQAEVFVVVESGFDAILVASLFGGLIGAITTWNSAARPDAAAHALLCKSSCILGGLDYDQGGDREQPWWQQQYQQYRRLPALPGSSKDPGDAALAGVDLFAWVKDGLPRGLQIKLGLTSGQRPLPQQHRDFVHENHAEQPGQQGGTKNQEKAHVVELELTGGKTVYITDDRAAWKELSEQGKPVFSQRELLRLQTALAGLDEEERAKAIMATIEVKEELGGYIVRGRKGDQTCK